MVEGEYGAAAKDVALVLDYADTKKMTRIVDDEEVSELTTYTLRDSSLSDVLSHDFYRQGKLTLTLLLYISFLICFILICA